MGGAVRVASQMQRVRSKPRTRSTTTLMLRQGNRTQRTASQIQKDRNKPKTRFPRSILFLVMRDSLHQCHALDAFRCDIARNMHSGGLYEFTAALVQLWAFRVSWLQLENHFWLHAC